MHRHYSSSVCIHACRLVTDKDSGKLKGYGFCEYYEQAAAEIAVQNINSREVSGRQLRVDFADDNMKGDERDGRRGPPAHFRGEQTGAVLRQGGRPRLCGRAHCGLQGAGRAFVLC